MTRKIYEASYVSRKYGLLSTSLRFDTKNKGVVSHVFWQGRKKFFQKKKKTIHFLSIGPKLIKLHQSRRPTACTRDAFVVNVFVSVVNVVSFSIEINCPACFSRPQTERIPLKIFERHPVAVFDYRIVLVIYVAYANRSFVSHNSRTFNSHVS